jgi:endonuclease/exonuclease/phosphatase family metal-dependent hydrolase
MLMKILTLNLRNHWDRWEARFPLVVAALLAADADLIAFQEVSLLVGEKHQAALIAETLHAALGRAVYHIYLTEGRGEQKGREALAVLSRWPVLSADWMALPGELRVAQKVQVRADDRVVTLFNTHLHHEPVKSEYIRYPQAEKVLSWMGDCTTPAILTGDMNARPDSSTIQLFKESLVSAHAVVHGAEPDRTWPTPLVDSIPEDEVPGALDYIFLSKGDFMIRDCSVIGDDPAADDPSLYPSDHFGIAAEVELRRDVEGIS